MSIVANEDQQRLADWFVQRVFSITRLDRSDQYHLLLCAQDLGITDSHAVGVALMEAVKPAHSPFHLGVVEGFLRQVVLMRFRLNEEERREFLREWITERRISGQDIVTVAYVVGLAAEQQQLLNAADREYVSAWFLRHRDIESRRVRGWLPRYLFLTGHRTAAIEESHRLLQERTANGSWDGNLRSTAAISYALSTSSLVSTEALLPGVQYVTARLIRGFSGQIAHEATVLKLLAQVDLLAPSIRDDIRVRLQNEVSVFLSHSSADKAFVRQLAADLRQAGVRVWLDEAEIKPGESIVEKIETAISEMRYLVVVLSPAAVASGWVRRELSASFFDGLSRQSIRVIPVKKEECEAPLLIRDIKYADFSSDYQQGFKDLLSTLLPNNESAGREI